MRQSERERGSSYLLKFAEREFVDLVGHRSVWASFADLDNDITDVGHFLHVKGMTRFDHYLFAVALQVRQPVPVRKGYSEALSTYVQLSNYILS